LSPSSPRQATERLWTADFVLDLLAAHFLFASYSSLFTIIPRYVLDRGGEEWQIGIIVGSFGVVGLLIRPYAGRWTYLVGAKRIVFIGGAIYAVASILYIPAFNVWWLVPARLLQGVGLALGPVATATIVANLAPVSRRGEALSYMGNAIGVSYLYAPVFSFWLLTHFGFNASFLFTAACAVLSAILALRISATRTAFPPSAISKGSVPLVSRSALFPTAVFLSYTFTTAPVNTFLPLLAEERGLGNPGLYFTVYSLTSLFFILLSGPIADRRGRTTVIVPGLLLAASAMFLLTFASTQLMFLGAGFLTGAGFGLLQPGFQSLTIDRAPPRERSSALATLQQAWDVGGSGGAFAMGPIGGLVGIAATFAIAGAGTLAGVAGFLAGNARRPAVLPEEQASSPASETQDT
jgi:MFS family permease